MLTFIQSPTGYGLAYFPGDTAIIQDEELAAKLIADGIAKSAADSPPGTEKVEDRRDKTKAEKR